jgi:zinc protease
VINITSHTLSNSLKYIHAADHSNPLVCLQLYVRIGSAWEEDAEAGFSHFTEHLVFKATRSYPDNGIMERITYLGGSINAYTEYDSTCFYCVLPSKFIDEGLKILSEIASHATYDEADFKAEKKVVIEEYKQYLNDPEESFIEDLGAYYFDKNLYRKPIIGDVEILRQSSHQDLLQFYHKYYVPSNAFLVISGDVSQSQLAGLLEVHFGSWQNRSLTKRTFICDDVPGKAVYHHFPKKISNDMLAFVLPDLAEKHPDSQKLAFVTKVLAMGKNSRLYERLFNQEQLVDGIKVHSQCGIESGAAIIFVMPKSKADLGRIIQIVREEINLLLQFGISAKEIRDQKNELIHHYRYSFEYVESLASSLGNEEVLHDYRSFLDYPQRMAAITKADLDAVARNYFRAEYIGLFHCGKADLPQEITQKFWQDAVPYTATTTSGNDYEEVVLPNGMKLIMKHVLGKPTVGISLSAHISQLDESLDMRGVNSLMSALLLYGNQTMNHKQFLNYCIEQGISLGITPAKETTNFRMKCFRETLPLGLELLADVLLKPTFPQNFLENIRQSYISTIDRIKDYPNYYAGYLWKQQIFGKSSRLLSRFGIKGDLRALNMRKVKQWYSEHLLTAPMTISIVGDYDFHQVRDLCNKLFAAKPISQPQQERRIILPEEPILRKTTRRNSQQAVVHVGGFGCSAMEQQQNTAFHVLSQIIGGDTDSILFNELREERGLAYSTDFDFESIRQMGYFVAGAIVDRTASNQVIDIIMDILAGIKVNGITAEDLQKTKNYIRGQRLQDEESMLAQAQMLSVLDVLGLGYDYYLQRDQRLEKVSLDAIHDLAREYFNSNAMYIHVLK